MAFGFWRSQTIGGSPRRRRQTVVCGWWAVLAAALAPGLAAQAADFTFSANGLSGDNFQSHNQKVVYSSNGIYRSGYDGRLQRSTNGGTSFSTMYNHGISGLKPPALEADPFGNVYMLYPDPSNDITRMRKVNAGGFVNSWSYSGTSSSKFSSAYDAGQHRLYHATQTGQLMTIDADDGVLIRSQNLFSDGSTGSRPSYPHVMVDEFGVIHYALTVADQNDSIPYESIRYMKSLDGGATWRTMSGQGLSLPSTSDPNGPSTRINYSGENTDNTWLANMHAKNGKVHFAYKNTSNGAMRYLRFDEETGGREITTSSFAGGSWEIDSAAVSFASDTANSTGALYAVGGNGVGSDSGDGHRQIALVSYDNGESWQDYARSDDFDITYNVGLTRSITPDGKIIGGVALSNPWASTNFLQIDAAEPATTIAHWDGGGNDSAWDFTGNWVGNVGPTFNNKLAVAIGSGASTARFDTMRIGSDRKVRGLIFGAHADADVNLRLHNAPGAGRTLTFESNVPGGSAEINVHHDATGDIDLGGGFADGDIVLGDSLRISHNGSGKLMISRPISGNQTITKLGDSVVELSGNNAGFSGMLDIQQGKLALGDAGSVSGLPDVHVASGGTLSLGDAYVGGTAEIGNLTGGGLIDPQYQFTVGTRTLQVNQTTDDEFSGVLQDATNGDRVLALVKSGAGTLTLSGNNAYSGGATVEQGTLVMRNDAIMGGNGLAVTAEAAVVAAGATLELKNDSGSERTPGKIAVSGDGTVQKTGADQLTHTSSQSTVALGSDGLFWVHEGVYKFGADTPGDWAGNRGDLQVDDGATFRGASTHIFVDALNGGGTVRTGGGLTLGADGGSGTFSGVIGDDPDHGSAHSVTKIGSGVQTLAGANTYTGPTSVQAGKLLVTGSLTSDITVSGGVFGGGGTVGDLTLTAGKHSPGASVGIDRVNDYDLQTNATLEIEIGGLAGAGIAGGHDQVDVTGSVTLSGELSLLAADDWSPTPGSDVFVLINNDAADPIVGGFAGLAEGDLVTLSNNSGSFDFVMTYEYDAVTGTSGVGNDVALVSVVPEPSALVLAAAAMFLLPSRCHQR